MFKIVEKKSLNPTVTKMVVEAPLIAKKAEPGQFIIFRAKEDSERIPLTISDFDREAGTVTIIYQIVGGSTMELDTLNEGEYIHDFVGPLGVPTHTEGLKKVAVVGGGVGVRSHIRLLKNYTKWAQKFILSWDFVIKIWLFLRMSSRVPVTNML